MSDIASRKKEFRKRALAKRNAIPAATQHLFSERICELVLSQEFYLHADAVAAYSPIRSEVDITTLLRNVISSGKNLLLPRVEGKELVFCEVNKLSSLVPGTFGVSEPPVGSVIYDREKMRSSRVLVLFPGAAFGGEGERMGYGGGYYDRFFRELAAAGNVVKAGVCYSSQLHDDVPVDDTDVTLDMIITETGIIRVRAN